MRIGLLSDTHAFLDPGIFDHFSTCDELWHAGDVGDAGVIDALQKFKPLRGVHGNIDDGNVRQRLPENLWFECEGLHIWITHIGGVPPRYNATVKKQFREKVPDIFICGHSHILRIGRDQALNNMLFINPGACGNHGFHQMKTIVRLEIRKREILKMEVIELGRRGTIPA